MGDTGLAYRVGNDLRIAAHAIPLGCTLVTDNGREFARIDGLNIEK